MDLQLVLKILAIAVLLQSYDQNLAHIYDCSPIYFLLPLDSIYFYVSLEIPKSHCQIRMQAEACIFNHFISIIFILMIDLYCSFPFYQHF